MRPSAHTLFALENASRSRAASRLIARCCARIFARQRDAVYEQRSRMRSARCELHCALDNRLARKASRAHAMRASHDARGAANEHRAARDRDAAHDS
jgi:hypothetical protein